MESLNERSFAEVGFGLFHGCWNAGPSRRNKKESQVHRKTFSSNWIFVKIKKKARKYYSESTVLSKMNIGALPRRCRPFSLT